MKKNWLLFIVFFLSKIYPQTYEMNPQTNPFANIQNQSLSLYGFAETPWNSAYSQVYDGFKTLATSNLTNERIEIVAAQKDQFILIKRNNILYRYNFYKTPYEVAKLRNQNLTQEDHNLIEGVLFQVKVLFPFIEANQVVEKIEAQYGKKTKSTVDPKTLRGVDIWDLPGGVIFVWYEPYNNKPYTRKIDYISKEISQRILEETKDYFDSKEKELLRDIIIK
ncbi:MAG: hypothetical protein NZ853_05600 [Leptospiraceae bacterium]|nr:hypothetical protein [Leptospiraceae bacterium]MDW7976577.1 hypothetical protein [Leptospiraceae bacterium]